MAPACSTSRCRSDDIVSAISALTDRGVEFLRTPDTYYDRLGQRLDLARYDVGQLHVPQHPRRRGPRRAAVPDLRQVHASAPDALLRGHRAAGRANLRQRKHPGALRGGRGGADQDPRRPVTTTADQGTDLAALLSLDDVALAARRVLAEPVWDYVAGGSGTESTLRRQPGRVRPGPPGPAGAGGGGEYDLGTELLGTPMGMPVGVAPMAYQRLLHPDGEVGTRRGRPGRGRGVRGQHAQQRAGRADRRHRRGGLVAALLAARPQGDRGPGHAVPRTPAVERSC